jgi:hypothetical protein
LNTRVIMSSHTKHNVHSLMNNAVRVLILLSYIFTSYRRNVCTIYILLEIDHPILYEDILKLMWNLRYSGKWDFVFILVVWIVTTGSFVRGCQRLWISAAQFSGLHENIMPLIQTTRV